MPPAHDQKRAISQAAELAAAEHAPAGVLDQRDAGAAILMVSEELEEILALSDRIVVMYEGEIVGEVQERDPALIGMMMTGGKRSASEGQAA